MNGVAFRARASHLVPVASSLLFAILHASLVLESKTELPSFTAFPEAEFGPLLNAAVFVVSMGVGGITIYLLIKLGIRRLIRFMIVTAITLITFILSLLYLEMVFLLLNVVDVGLWSFFLATSLTILANIEVFLRRSSLHKVVLFALAGALGAFLGASVPTISTVAILLSLSLYDAVAVFIGPLGKIALKEGLDSLQGIAFSFGDVQMGFGDLTFYSMLVGHFLLNFGWVQCLAAVLGIVLGSYLSFKMLERRQTFPGLPLPVVFGLAVAYLSTLI